MKRSLPRHGQDARTYRRLPREYKSSWLRSKHRLKLTCYRLFACFDGGVRALDRALDLACARSRHDQGGFRLALPRVLRQLNTDLKVDVPTSTLRLGLHDWLTNGTRIVHPDAYFVGSGDWSAIAYALKDNVIVREAHELLDSGMAYRETSAYQAYLLQIRDGQPARRNRISLDSVEKVDRYFERFVSLFDSIRTKGLLRHDEVARGISRLRAVSPARRWLSEVLEQDIGVAVGADGTLYKLPGGQHRVAIAIALGLPVLPVEVRLVHQVWLRQALAAHPGRPLEALRRELQALPAILAMRCKRSA